jgi:hypothetical protein
MVAGMMTRAHIKLSGLTGLLLRARLLLSSL